jgi:hypothetical protein
MQKWEYCLVELGSDRYKDRKWVIEVVQCATAPREPEVIITSAKRDDDFPISAWAPVLARLGGEGWEAVGFERNGNNRYEHTVILLKRPVGA